MRDAVDTRVELTKFFIFEDHRGVAKRILKILNLDKKLFVPEFFERKVDFYRFFDSRFRPNANQFFWLDLNIEHIQEEGIYALIKIKKKNPAIPVLIFSAYESYEKKCLEAGADFFITKKASRLYEDIQNVKTILAIIRGVTEIQTINKKFNDKLISKLPKNLQEQVNEYLFKLKEPPFKGYHIEENLASDLSDKDVSPSFTPYANPAEEEPEVASRPPEEEREAPSQSSPEEKEAPSQASKKADFNPKPKINSPHFPPVFIEQALIATPKNSDADMTKEAKIYFGRKVLDYFEQIKLAAERKRAAIKEEMTLDNPDPDSIPDLDIQDPMWVAGSQSWQIRYPDNKIEAEELSENKNAYLFSIFYDEANELSKLSFTVDGQQYEWKLNLEGIEEIYAEGYRKLIRQLPEQYKILLNLVIAKVCAQAYTALDDAHEEQRQRIFNIGEKLNDEWRPEILKLVIQYYNKNRAPLETIKEALDNWHEEAGFPEVMDVLKGQIIEINPQTKEAKVYLSSFLYPSWNTEEYWESTLFENKGMIEGTYFLYTAIKLYGRIHAFDIDIVDFT